MDQQECLVQELAEDLLSDVLRRLPPRSLAMSRCVCKAWRVTIDSQMLLRAELLPHSLGGIFIDFNMLGYTEFFSCNRAVSGNLSYTPDMTVKDHCNGLVLLYSCVANPATRQWTHLPTQPPPVMQMGVLYELPYLVFDPAVSPHYEVFLIPVVPDWAPELDYMVQESEWPPSLMETHVFSSRTGCWEETSFVRQGEPAGTMADMQKDGTTQDEKRHAVYWRGDLYVHGQHDFFWRISTSNGKYHVIKPPVGSQSSYGNTELHLGKSKDGVCCAMVDADFKLRVWNLKEPSSSGHTAEWVLKHQNNIEHLLSSPDYLQQDRGPWFLEDINYYSDHSKDGNEEEQTVKPKLKRHSYVTLLGFHPFEEIVFLNSTMTRGVAYDLNNSKAQDLGYTLPKNYDYIAGHYGDILTSFPYTPCWMEDTLPGQRGRSTPFEDASCGPARNSPHEGNAWWPGQLAANQMIWEVLACETPGSLASCYSVDGYR